MKKIIFLSLLLCTAGSLVAQTFTFGGINYTVTSATTPLTVEVSDNSGFIGTANIPASTVDGGNTYAVTSIGDSAFSGCSDLTSITIPNSITSIGQNAFAGCFSLTSLTIPTSVTSIGHGAFGGCASLESIIIPNSVTSIGNGVFVGCTYLSSISLPNTITSIGFNAFLQCGSLTSVTIPNSVTSIGPGAFAACASLESIIIPNSVTSIGYAAFFNCSSLTFLSIPHSITTIGEDVFYGCYSITSLTIPNSIVSIGKNAFSNCSSITSITIPNSVTSIGVAAFSGCVRATSLSIANSVNSIGSYAFARCSALTSVQCDIVTPLNILNRGVFDGVNQAACILTVPAGSISAYQAAPVWQDFLIATGPIIAGGNVSVCSPVTALNLSGVSLAFTNSTTLTLAGVTAGSTVVWQRSTNFVNTTNAVPSWSTVANTTTVNNNLTVTPTSAIVVNLTTTTWYRAKVTISGGTIVYATPVKITVTPAARAGSISVPPSVCFGDNITFTSAAYTGSSIAWEVSTTSSTIGFTAVAGANGPTFTMSNVAFAPLSRFYVRSVVTSGSCSIARSSVKTVTVNPLSVAGTALRSGTFCSGSNAILRLVGQIGTIHWVYSTDGITFYNVPFNSPTLGYQNPDGATSFSTTSAGGRSTTYLVNNLTSTTYFKAVVKSGACSTSDSNVVVFTVGSSAIAGTATSAAASVCYGDLTTISLSGQAGTIQWQKSTNWSATTPTWSNVNTSTTATVSTGALFVATAFRAMVSIGACSSPVFSNIVVVTRSVGCRKAQKIETPIAIETPFEIVAYPNPSTNIFNLKVNGATDENFSILVFDMIGKQIENKTVDANEVENLALGQNYVTGIYNVIVSQGTNTKTVRLIKK
ncbi:leucine-rich repeat protein [Flavobacterium sp.]|uniref:leucine-rich repeat protein n=1 Tax=Flavobacterium sp. TaxID=239 RepID=UPI00286DFE4F|nr:leucine-rich repeat protein [Flavobacterium sp.]